MLPAPKWLVQLLAGWLRDALGDDFHVRQEQPLTFADSEPEPDIAVVPGSADDFRLAHPRQARLVIEVALASAAIDREKADLYSAAGVAEYWLILPQEKAVEVYTGASSSGYTQCRRYTHQNEVPLHTFPHVTLDLGRLLA